MILSGHIARVNPQSQTFGLNEEVLVQFDGPHTYVSAAWYSSQSVPTWNYITVQAYGKLRTIDSKEELYVFLKEMVDSQEKDKPEQERYRLESLPADRLNNMMSVIVGFKITVTTMECAAKLSQNLNSIDYENIITRLKERNYGESAAIAAEMEARRKK
jgi:transcriptional regulator